MGQAVGTALANGNLALLRANMKVLVIGSTAAAKHSYTMRKDVYEDIDIIASNEDTKHIISSLKNDAKSIRPNKLGYSISFKERRYCFGYAVNHLEIIVAWKGSIHEKILNENSTHMISFASLNLLLTLKESHKYLRNSPHFDKTMADIRQLRLLGAKVIRSYIEELEKIHYDYSHPALNVSKKEFFKDDVPYVYDHDSIHVSVAGWKRRHYPAYKLFLDGEVKCSQLKFNRLGQEDRLRAVVEESCVLAIERSLVPFPGVKTPEEAFKMALEKVCTSITSGWFREFAWENYDAATKLFEKEYSNYWMQFKLDVEENKVKKHGK